MRFLCEIFVIGGLLYLGWDKPFHERLPKGASDQSVPAAPTPPPAVVAIPAPSNWIHDPNRRSALDTPQPQPAKPSAGSWMWDSAHRSPLDPPRKSSTPH